MNAGQSHVTATQWHLNLPRDIADGTTDRTASTSDSPGAVIFPGEQRNQRHKCRRLEKVSSLDTRTSAPCPDLLPRPILRALKGEVADTRGADKI